MKHSIKVGFSFGITSGIITTLGLMVGLSASTHSKLAVIGGILTIAIADAFSDALGIHVSEESEGKHSQREVWESTFSALICKFVFALTFIVPVLLFSLSSAIIVNIIWGLLALTLLSYNMAKGEGEKPFKVIFEHVIIVVAVVIITHYLGRFISGCFS